MASATVKLDLSDVKLDLSRVIAAELRRLADDLDGGAPAADVDAPAWLARLNRCWLEPEGGAWRSRAAFVGKGPSEYWFSDAGPFLHWLLTGEGGPT